MGIAASQGRYLQLVARDQDVTYQGEQINHQRLTLANTTARLSEDISNLPVPVPPSTSEFTQNRYTGNSGATRFEIGQVIPNGQFYNVNLRYTRVGHCLDLTGRVYVNRAGDPGSYTYSIGLGDDTVALKTYQEAIDDGDIEDDPAYIAAIKNYFPEFVNSDPIDIKASFFIYMSHSTSNTAVTSPNFMREADVVGLLDYPRTANSYAYIANGTYIDEQTIDDCSLNFDSSGRITDIGIPYYEGDTLIGRNQYSLECSTTTDDAAYQDAFNKYQYDRSVYDQTIQEMNAKLSIYQAEDKDLELKLKRLDTEHNAITTEIETLKDVIKKAVEGSYKTFNG